MTPEEAAAEIHRLRLEVAVLRERLTQHEAARAMRRGSLQADDSADRPMRVPGGIQDAISTISFNAPASAPPHGEPAMSDHDPNRAENVRLAIASQPSVEQGISALLRTVATHLHEAVESGDLSQLKALADHINENPRAWSDALLANTPAAPQTIAPTVPQMPAYVQDAFRDHSVLAHDAQQRQAEPDSAPKPESSEADPSGQVPEGMRAGPPAARTQSEVPQAEPEA